MVEVRLIDGQLKMQRFYRDDVPVADAKGNLAAFFTLLHRQVLDLLDGLWSPMNFKGRHSPQLPSAKRSSDVVRISGDAYCCGGGGRSLFG